ncbi:MAG TPA: UDP-N-acetylglucosamine--N-acetylmuramyl-(pentapeptide) pyrophosphoryl-undecaprenol N-acetylglucosamine transferase, partial [Opitutaceae bacterium]|nr:UDP-N-acetylglucosamine--N-acetylmuramyl-(pentapeptide) pyrophosphoryl-undecaprenol N-acetylglucosamine transferase [Opitutaceae bacterium]
MTTPTRHYIIACGGTGGHLAPGIALAEGLVARSYTVQLLVSRKTIDSKILEKYKGLDAVAVPAAPFTLSPAGFCRFAWQQASGLWFCIGLVRRTRPNAIIGFGGFTTMGIMLAGLLLRVPLIMHEANRVPGRATREFGPFARRVWVPEGVDLPMVRPARVRECGLPVRAEFRRKQKAAAMAELGFVPATRTLVVLGGSQGASALNDWAAGAVKPLAAAGAQIICVTGPGKTNDRIVTVLSANNGSTIHSYRMPFCDRMAELLSCADLVVTRAGAGTIAELARIGVPSILVPYPQAADNHQIANARFVEQQGGG